MRRSRNVKILATLGPASDSMEMVETLFLAGADAFRINMSHADHGTLTTCHDMIRQVEQRHSRPIGILVDLQGPKLRIGEFATDEVTIEAGREFVLDDDPAPGDASRVHLPHPEIFAAVHVGDQLLLNDGRVRLSITHVEPGRIVTRVIHGGVLSARKGVNLPDTVVPLAALTEKDRENLEYACQLGVDWIALSFVQRPDDVAAARKLVRGRAGVLAKIEKPSALQSLREIIELSDALMVARGDLGVELPLEAVPGWQKRITRAARRAGKPVVIATQMLESMIENPAPTRAEVSDVATAVFEGADAIMLSAESAAGKWPKEAVMTMDRIAQNVESDPNYRGIIESQLETRPEPTSADAISAAARSIASTLKVACIVSYTSSGSTGQRISRERPEVPILALSPKIATARRLSIAWGLHCVLSGDPDDLDDMVERACRIAFQEGFAAIGDRVLITCGVPLGTPGTTNMLRLADIRPDAARKEPPQPELL
ncbi:MAG TPA: pyruvate kinase [Thermopetrobacter sp.]|nr:pyruvate kinase [Thermopetrobacter sp.]